MSEFNLVNLNGNNGFRLDGITEGDNSGVSVSNAGDVNGDGFDDVIVGAPGVFSNGGYIGSSFVVFGKASGFNAAMKLSDLDGSNGFRLDGDVNYTRSGSSVSNAGDINGDGFDDLMVSAYGTDPGISYVVFGKSSGFDATINLSNLDGSDGFRLDTRDLATYVVALSPDSVSAAGDINGDGFDDLIVGDPDGGTIVVNHYYTYYSSGEGASYVVFGKASGFDAVMDLSNLDGNNGFRLNGTEQNDYSGESVSTAGDVNGDGFDDLIIGASYADSNGNRSGSSYVVFGKDSGFDAAMNLSDLDGTNGFRLDGAAEGDYSGESVSAAGDINGDGLGDLIVGSSGGGPKDTYGSSLRYGASYIVFGKTSGFDATMDLADLNGSNGFRLDGAAANDHLGVAVSNAGDVNGDGFDDLIAGAKGAGPRDNDGNTLFYGASYVIFGKASGFDAAMDLSDLNSSEGFRLNGATAYDTSGTSVSMAGDINGDGFDDLIVGAPGADPSGIESGSSYVIFGRADFSDEEIISGTSGRDILQGTSAAEHFEAGAGNDRMIGNGGADVFHGDAGNDYIRVRDLNFELANGGKGYDTLGLGGKNLNLDLTSMGDKINDIEAIYLYGSGDNTLTLNAANVLDASNTTNILRVLGDAGDKIIGLSSGWEDGGIHEGEQMYTNGEATLLVGIHVTTDFA
jgi:hypothetical protein